MKVCVKTIKKKKGVYLENPFEQCIKFLSIRISCFESGLVIKYCKLKKQEGKYLIPEKTIKISQNSKTLEWGIKNN